MDKMVIILWTISSIVLLIIAPSENHIALAAAIFVCTLLFCLFRDNYRLRQTLRTGYVLLSLFYCFCGIIAVIDGYPEHHILLLLPVTGVLDLIVSAALSPQILRERSRD